MSPSQKQLLGPRIWWLVESVSPKSWNWGAKVTPPKALELRFREKVVLPEERQNKTNWSTENGCRVANSRAKYVHSRKINNYIRWTWRILLIPLTFRASHFLRAHPPRDHPVCRLQGCIWWICHIQSPSPLFLPHPHVCCSILLICFIPHFCLIHAVCTDGEWEERLSLTIKNLC